VARFPSEALLPTFFDFVVFTLDPCDATLTGLVCWRQELEDRARDKYGAFDQMSAELRRLQE
jgi:hypothetical protein